MHPRRRYRCRPPFEEVRCNFQDDSDGDVQYVQMKLLGYLLNYLRKVQKIPDRGVLNHSLKYLSDKELAALLQKVKRTAKGREIDITNYLEEFDKDDGNYAEVLEEIFKGKHSLGHLFFKEIYRKLDGKVLKHSEIRGASRLHTKLNEVSKIFSINDLETEILFMLYLYETDEVFDELVESFKVISNIKYSGSHFMVPERCIACFTGSGNSEVLNALGQNSRIAKLELVDENKNPASELIKYLAGQSNRPIVETYFKEAEGVCLPISKFTIPEVETATITALLSSRKMESKTNILLYGVPGTGKTEFARSLGKHLGLQVYDIRNPEDDYGPFRLRALTACQNMVDLKKSLIVMDEADDLLESVGNFLLQSSRQDKGKINTILDNIRGTVIWITNRYNLIDESTLRRFDYSINFPNVTHSQRMNIWKTQLTRHKPKFDLEPRDIEALADTYEVNAGGISFAVKNAMLIHGSKSSKAEALNTIHNLLSSHVKLLHGEQTLKRGHESNSVNYSLEGLNIKGNMDSVMNTFQAFNRYWDGPITNGPVRNMNLLMSGPPGTGKTEFAKYLARSLKRRLIIKQASDLLDMYVGQSEKFIRASFQEAERDKSILFIDEADGLLASREGARQSWQVTQVNEILSGMEQFRGIFLCATNFRDNVDSASIRRFNFKVEFDYLTAEGTEIFYKRILADLTSKKLSKNIMGRLRGLKGLTPGDFKVVYQKHYFLERKSINHDCLIEALGDEVRNKDVKGLVRMGF